MGLISQGERHDLIVDQWTAATEEVGQAMEDNLDELNPIFMMANSGARGSFKQIRQLAGMRGLMANPKGEIIERPIKANFVEGLTVQEYFISTHGARKGLADTALRTADSGYLTRRLVDVSQDVIIRENDCKTKDDVEVEVWRDGDDQRHHRRSLTRPTDWATKRGRMICGEERNDHASSTLADAEETFADEPDAMVHLRSVLKCKAATGICQKCFGASLATGQLAEIGDAVGIIAAQSIGEPGTQLTMRTFHTGGIAGADITHGLPRIVELFEARKPKGLAVLSEQAGKVAVEETDKARKITITDEAGEEHAYSFPRRTRLYVEHGEKIEAGHPAQRRLALPARPAAHQRPHGDRGVPDRRSPEGLQVTGRRHQRQAHRNHRASDDEEGVVSSRRATRTSCPGQFIDINELEQLNKDLKKAKKEQVQFEEVILGITKASLATESFLSAASFQETTKVLTDAALDRKTDRLVGLKENVIIGKLIPAATGLKRYRTIEIEPTEPLPAPGDVDFGRLSAEELAALV